MQVLENELNFEWVDVDAPSAKTTAKSAGEEASKEWLGSPLQEGMQAVRTRLVNLADSLAATPLDIRIDYEIPHSEPMRGLRQGGYKLIDTEPQCRRFSFHLRCVGDQRFVLREGSRPARDARARWLTERGLDFHVEDSFGSQWHFTILVRPVVPVRLDFEADAAQDYLRISFSNFETLETVVRSVPVDAITPAMLDELERLVLRRPNRFDEFTGNRVDNDVRAKFREAIEERRRERAAEIGEGEDADAANRGHPGKGADSGATADRNGPRAPAIAPTFVGPRDDEGALEWGPGTGTSEVEAPTPGPNAPPAYAWLVTAGGVEDTAANLGKLGPSGASRHFPIPRVLKEGREFRLRDRDGKIAFTGKIAGNFKGLEPIADFGLDHGCLRIEYLRGDRWTELRAKPKR